MYEFKLPDLGEGIHEGEILKWIVNAGDNIKEDQPLVEVETDKAAVTIPSPVAGKVVSLMGKPGDIVNTGNVLIVIDDGSSPSKAPPESQKKVAPGGNGSKKLPSVKEEKPVQAAEKVSGRPVPAAPATRRLARELGVDLKLVTPSGPAGRVTSEDVNSFAKSGKKPSAKREKTERSEASKTYESVGIPYLDIGPVPDFSEWGEIETEPLRSIRRRIAHHMVTTKTLVPHVVHMDEADLTELDDFIKARKNASQDEIKVRILSFIAKAVVLGLKKFRSFNASLDHERDEIVYKKFFNIGFAADTEKGLMVPVLKDADKKNILEISSEIEKLAVSAREGTISVSDLKGGTFTITNVGAIGGTGVIAAINYPEVAILGMGRLQEKPVVRNGEIVARKMLPLSLSFDHRVADGAEAARFMSYLIRLLSDPGTFLTEI